ncbi:MAG: DUF2236 domain-containing protein [Prolixibacteraceae bacterium]|nr:DUF2236 domain-containing protein [Prolixibacteraceae bacterium]MBT6767273.1 DUF2236 domain-containing protein [Prolixibacteraceae bacterium]MBT6999157.1 DUF2236 domain-containing protein [Prolixibacteraceae bacterium]MBT7395970.1 DUF2236 domain-containing protein [Prolixibacteraceae bacterium]
MVKQYEWNGLDLEKLRLVMDKPSDDAVESIFQSQSMAQLRTILKDMAINDSFVSEKLPKPMHDFVQGELNYTFSDDDIANFEATHHIWKKHGMQFIFILFFRALPYTYMAEKPANVLRITKLLETHTERRIFETAQFVFDVMDRNWWEPGKRGIMTALKIRIMHSSMRHVILDENKTGDQWNMDWGKPISQEDLVATNQVFSLEFFKGMSMLGKTLDVKDQQAWFHTWKTIGKLMGVQDNLISKDVDEAWKLQHKIYDHLFNDETHSGIALAKALVETLHHFHLPLKLILLIMRALLADEQFPDCFTRMLGPTYKDEYPDVFKEHQTQEERDKHQLLLNLHFRDHLKEYHTTLTEKRNDYVKKQGVFKRFSEWLLETLGIRKKRSHLYDKHLGLFHNILHDDKGNVVEKFEEHMIVNSMSAFGGIFISILSLYFRKGKNSGFRIPGSLQDNWDLKG